ncbi:MAG: hypothetical protein HOV83_28450 [Catenulispora sp.]|nr:hypothetical protein [Catenulispora sp.]
MVEVASPAGEDEADERVPLGVPVVGTLLPDASGDAARNELSVAVGVDPVAVLDDAATVSWCGDPVPTTAVITPTTDNTATAAQTLRCANNRRPRTISALSFSRCD